MPDKPDNPFKFWEELKRRKVIRVIIGYLAAAYVLLELISIISEPFRLPEWTLRFVFVLLCIGFVITAIISWIYDVTPGGIKKTEPSKTLKEKSQPEPSKRKLRVSNIIIAVLLVAVVVLLYPKVFNKDKFEDVRDSDGKISIAVMPFVNMTNDTLWNIWQEGIQNEIINYLSNTKELSIRQPQTIYDILEGTNYASFSPSIASSISQKINTNTLLFGSIKEYGDVVRLNAQIINSKTEEVYKTFMIEGNREKDLFSIIDTLSFQIKSYFQVKAIEENLNYEERFWAVTDNPEAYRFYVRGVQHLYKGEWESVIEVLNRALEIDTSAYAFYVFQIAAYSNNRQPEKARQALDLVYKYRDEVPYYSRLLIDFWKAKFDKNPNEYLKILNEILNLDSELRTMWYQIGLEYLRLDQYEKSIVSFEKVLELDKQRGVPWEWPATYRFLGEAYHEAGNHKREKEVYELGHKIFPEDYRIIYRQAICAISQGDTIMGNELLERYVALGKEHEGWDDAAINSSIGYIYYQANILDRAEQYYRKALELYPNGSTIKYRLATMYFNNDFNIDEGLELINRALEKYPNSSAYQRTKAWGLYKDGKNEEALDLFQKSWDLSVFYSHTHFLHIQEVKQAIAEQEN